jgi:hypothetical protein
VERRQRHARRTTSDGDGDSRSPPFLQCPSLAGLLTTAFCSPDFPSLLLAVGSKDMREGMGGWCRHMRGEVGPTLGRSRASREMLEMKETGCEDPIGSRLLYPSARLFSGSVVLEVHVFF